MITPLRFAKKKKKTLSGLRKVRNGSRYDMIRYACKWESYTLLRLNSSCGTTTYTRRSRYSQDHYTRELQCPRIMATSEERASKKAKTVDNESGTRKYGTGTSVRVARVDFLTLCCCCTWYDVDRILKVRCITEKTSHVQSILVLLYDIQYTCSCCLPLCGPQRPPPKGRKPSRGVAHRD